MMVSKGKRGRSDLILATPTHLIEFRRLGRDATPTRIRQRRPDGAGERLSMLRLPPFRYVRPASVAQAAAVLADHGNEAMVLAGGTDLLPNLKRRQFDAGVLVAVGHLEELSIFRSNGDIAIGAGMKLQEVAEHSLLMCLKLILFQTMMW